MCGEKRAPEGMHARNLGSPPRVRGKGDHALTAELVLRITPACAGKSLRPLSYTGSRWDHPRVCGEKLTGSKSPFTFRGSPPRVRGKGFDVAVRLSPYRITPACAGKSFLPLRSQQPARDHPRVCGEKAMCVYIFRIVWGSPPRMRGKDVQTDARAATAGITPACAGKSCFASSCSAFSWDHPRVCGEKPQFFYPTPQHAGSPPRVRGKVCGLFPTPEVDGITPACAGKRLYIPQGSLQG